MAYISAVFRAKIRHRFFGVCAYCRSPENLMGVTFEIDHIIPLAKGGNSQEDNLCLSCPTCNRYKASHITAIDPITRASNPLYHPIHDDWNEHFFWNDDASLLIGRTAIARATIELLKINRPILVELRRYWVELGKHPAVS